MKIRIKYREDYDVYRYRISRFKDFETYSTCTREDLIRNSMNSEKYIYSQILPKVHKGDVSNIVMFNLDEMYYIMLDNDKSKN
jgi:hypothetical protein